MTPLFGQTRTRVEWNHALIAPDGHVTSPLSGWENCEGVVLISPVLGNPQCGPRFCQYLVHGSDGCRTTGAVPGVQRAVYVLDGTATLDGKPLAGDGFAWLPPDDSHELTVPPGATLLEFEKPYVPLQRHPRPMRVITTLADAPREAFLGDEDAQLSTLLPVKPAFDMAINVFEFQPGTTLPFVETHVMEHGLYMRRGQGVYRLGENHYPVQAGDSIWMASYCPQWFVAMGKETASYIYYKDIHRDPLLHSGG